MGRYCADCGDWTSCSMFSRNQWLKGDGYSRCKDCVNGTKYQCSECYRIFENQNNLNMHMQVHRPRNVSCPICGETRFKSGANAVQHVESGYCRGCQGRERARQAIYDFSSRQSAMQQYLTDRPLLTYGGSNQSTVPELPYQCPECSRQFRQLSQLLQHQDQKHSNYRMLQY